MKNIEELLPKNICEINGKKIKITSDEFYNFTINKKFKYLINLWLKTNIKQVYT